MESSLTSDDYKSMKIEELLMHVESGNPIALNELAHKYDTEGEDADKVYELYLASAETGYRVAQYNVGSMWEFGDVPNEEKNMGTAMEWYFKSAIQGEHDAQYCLGRIYENTFNDIENSIKWYIKAAKQNNSKAIYKLNQHINHHGRAYNIIINQDDIIDNLYNTIDMLNENIKTLKIEIDKKRKYIIELECLPPDEGGKLFKRHRDSFYKNLPLDKST